MVPIRSRPATTPMERTHTLVALAIAGLPLTSIAQYTPPDPSGLEGIIVETYYVADTNDAADQDGNDGTLTAGSRVYRVYADLKPGYKLLTVGGFTNHPITFNTTTNFFNNLDRGEAWGDAINDIHLDKNTVAIDSWLAMGAASDAHWGVLKTEDPDGSIVGGVNNDGGSNGVPEGLLVNDAAAAGIPLTTADGLWSASVPPSTSYVGNAPECFNTGGPTYSDDNFAWAVLGGVEGPSADNRILLGQFTTDGVFSYCLNLWVRIPDSLVCNDPNCHTILEFYGNLLESDTIGGGFAGDNKFTLDGLCFTTSELQADCEGELGGSALPGTACDDGNPDTGGDIWTADCVCIGSVGIAEHNDALLRVFPNPTRDRCIITLSTRELSGMRMELRDAVGALVLTSTAPMRRGDRSEVLDLSSLNTGVYFLRVEAAGRTFTEKINKF